MRWGTARMLQQPTSPSPSLKRRVPSLSARLRAERAKLSSRFLYSAFLVFLAIAAHSAPRQVEDPDWPCQQRLVPKLTAAAYWNGLALEGLGDWRSDPELADLVRHLAPRRVSAEEGLAKIALFSNQPSTDRPRRLALVFRGLLQETDRERVALIEELKQIGRRQRELADLVARLATELKAIPSDAQGKEAEKRVDLQQRHDFTARNFEEIQRTIRYACETPVALDARLGRWARALQEATSE